jgi:hypothetical protein
MFYRCLGFAGITPPATLTVVSKNLTYTSSVPVLNFSKPGWLVETNIQRIALQAAVGFAVVPLEAPAPSLDWSYDLDFFGPTMRCAVANSTDQSTFNQITNSFETNDGVFIASQYGDALWNKTVQTTTHIIKPVRLLYSAWSGFFGAENSKDIWFPICRNESCTFPSCSGYCPIIYIQTSTSSITCNMQNASFAVTIASVNGHQQVIQRNIQPVPYVNQPVEAPADAVISESIYDPYIALLSTLLIGNLSLSNEIDFLNTEGLGGTNVNPHWITYAANTNMQSTGLLACADIQQSPFVHLSADGFETSSEIFTNTFPTESWMCRNQSFLRAIEDLANNITISFLSSPNLTDTNTTFRTTKTSNTQNYYQYRPFYLLLPYGLALLFSSIVAGIGLRSISMNGVSHSMGFSAIIATTRNRDLDALTRGASLGAEPLKTDISKAKLRLGPLLSSKGTMQNSKELGEEAHLAFGYEDGVGRIKKGARYT